jgi:hypothetical protein
VVAFIGNWVGDSGAAAVNQIVVPSGFVAHGNLMGGAAAVTAFSVPNSTDGVDISGNTLQTYSVGVALGSSVNNTQIGPNVRSSVTTYVSGTGNSGVLLLTNGTSVLYGAAQHLGDLSTDRGIGPGTPAVATQAGRIYQGSGVPSNSNGNNGDVYFRTDTPGTANQRMYMKSAGAWVALTL